MRGRLATLFICLVCTIPAVVGQTETETEPTLKGVREMRVYDAYGSVVGEEVQKGNVRKRLGFDNNGNLLEWTIYNTDGDETWRSTTKYDDKQRKTEVSIYTGNSVLEQKFIYAENGKVAEEQSFYNGNLASTIYHMYDNAGNLIETSGGETKTTYKYNGVGDLIEETHYVGNKKSSSSTYVYDSNRRKIKQGRNKESVNWKYDEKGNMVESLAAGSEGYRKTWKYDDNNQVTEQCEFRYGGQLFEKYTYKYNELNKLIEMYSYTTNGGIAEKTTTYKYDEKGNLIESLIINDGYVEGGQVREYDYYE